MAEQGGKVLSDWLELMLGEITRRQEEAQAADIEQAARARDRAQPSTSDETHGAASPPHASSPLRSGSASRARGATRRGTRA